MKNDNQTKILSENKKFLEESVYWLKRSFTICNEKFKIEDLSEEGFDAFESLTSRFARTTDILFNKVFRSIVYLEEGTVNTWLDTLIYMEKQGLISSTEDARLVKELRNDIVHEYVISDLKQLFVEVLNNCTLVFNFVDNTLQYVDNLTDKLEGK